MVAKHGAVMQAYSEGAEVQVRYPKREWGDSSSPDFRVDHEYRVKPAEPALDIPWDLLEEHLICAAMDKSRAVYLYAKTPKCYPSGTNWGSDCPTFIRLPLKNLNPRNVPWDKTLTYRPGFEPKD
jgi:hypothetical protein